MGRSFWRGSVVGIAAILFLAVNLELSRKCAAFDTTSTTPQTSSATSKKKKTNRHARPKPKPQKPVPLTALEPVPIELGESDQNPLETFFQALADLEAATPDATQPPVVHIIHYGDSHVASDYWAGVLREKLQARFGDAGPGFVLPGRPWPSIRYEEAKSLDGQGWRTDGFRYIENDGVVGLGGMSLESYREASPASALASFSQFQVFAATSPGSACLQVQIDDVDFPAITSQAEHIVPNVAPEAPSTLVPEPGSKSLGGGAGDPPVSSAPATPKKRGKKRRKLVPVGPPFKPWPTDSPLDLLELSSTGSLAAGPHRISILSSCGSQARVLGVELYSGTKGILYDTDGVNGARLADLEKPLPALRKALLKQASPTLIIVSYGTNDIATKGFTASDYEERAFHILSKLKEDAGDASILVTGPTDRGSPRKKTRAIIQAGQAELQPALRKAALRAGCAYWDEQAAMGGPGSMTRWVRAGLANYDYVHFSGLGYQKLANMLYDQLMAEYGKFQKADPSK
jgi:lysophospholipase L1-like esterase